MSEQEKPADATAASAVPATATPPAPAEPAPEKPRVQADALPPDALKARLESAQQTARRELLKELGVEDPKDAKQALAELKQRQDAERTELEKAQAEADTLKAKATKADTYREILSRRAMAEMADLTEQQRATIKELAGDDPASVVNVIDKMRAGGLLGSAQPKQPEAEKNPPKVPDTSPGKTAPDETNSSPPNHKAIHQELQQKNPFAAANYLAAHLRDIYPPEQ